MKHYIAFTALLLCSLNRAYTQEVIIKGTLRCLNNGVETSTRGATNIIIVPSFNPKAAVATSTTPEGFFQVNTGWDAKDLRDKNVTLYIITKCTSCQKIQRVFISEDLDKRNTDPAKLYVTIKGWKILENCQNSELPDILSAQLLDSARRLPPEDISGKATGSQALAPVSFLNLFEKLATIAVTPPPPFGLVKVVTIEPAKIKYGIFLHSSPMTNTDNTGFNFAPSRNLSEAVFWNPSAIAFSSKPYNVSLLANFKNNIKLSGYQHITKQFSLGSGGIYTRQDQIRQINVNGPSPDDSASVNHPEKLEEYAVFLAPVYQINNRVSVAVTVKSIWQQFNNPNLVSIEKDSNGTIYNFFRDDTVRRQRFDADVSFSYKINSFLQAGVSVMNVTGTKLYADAFVPDSTNQSYINQRAYGVGLCYKRGRLNAGADALFTDNGLYDVSVGVNYVPFNNGLIAAGYAFKQQSFSVAFRLKHFRIAYIYDNNLVVNDVKVAKSKVFDGKIYSGFVFDF